MARIEMENQTSVEEMQAMVRSGSSYFSRKPEIAESISAVPRDEIQSRYYGHRLVVLKWKDRTIRTLETWEPPKQPPAFAEGTRYFVTSRGYTARPDKIAVRQLGHKLYWWWVLYSNSITEPEDVKANTTIRIVRPPFENAFYADQLQQGLINTRA